MDPTYCFEPDDVSMQAFGDTHVGLRIENMDGNAGPFSMTEQLLGIGTSFADEEIQDGAHLLGRYLLVRALQVYTTDNTAQKKSQVVWSPRPKFFAGRLGT